MVALALAYPLNCSQFGSSASARAGADAGAAAAAAGAGADADVDADGGGSIWQRVKTFCFVTGPGRPSRDKVYNQDGFCDKAGATRSIT